MLSTGLIFLIIMYIKTNLPVQSNSEEKKFEKQVTCITVLLCFGLVSLFPHTTCIASSNVLWSLLHGLFFIQLNIGTCCTKNQYTHIFRKFIVYQLSDFQQFEINIQVWYFNFQATHSWSWDGTNMLQEYWSTQSNARGRQTHQNWRMK